MIGNWQWVNMCRILNFFANYHIEVEYELLFYANTDGEIKLKFYSNYYFYLLYKSMFVIIKKGEIADLLGV